MAATVLVTDIHFQLFLVYDHAVPLVICFWVWGIQFGCYLKDVINIGRDIMDNGEIHNILTKILPNVCIHFE